jgi:hypothetical protein
MHPYDNDDGLGVSLLIYASAILGALVLIMAPIYPANRPTVYQNSGVQQFDQVLPARAERHNYPLAHLEHRDIVDPAIVAALNAKAEAERSRRASASESHRVAHVRPTTRRTYADAAPARQANPFALFFSLF